MPIGCVDAYKRAKVWSNFYNITDKDFNEVETIEANNGDIDYSLPYEVYNMSGARVGESKNGLGNGIYILRQGEAVRKIVVR